MAQQKAKQENNDAFKNVQDLNNLTATILGRYLTLSQVPNGFTDKGAPRIKLIGSNTLNFKIRGDVYVFRKEIISGREELEKH